jgi:uncharacterized integral membrane protein (TIGR00697 family)
LEIENKYSAKFIVVTGVFITCLIISNIIAVKVIRVAGLNLPAAIVIFPISYIFGDILTEVYGYHTARKVIWLGFLCNLFAVLAMWLGGLLPSMPFWDANGAYSTPAEAQHAYDAILGFTPRLLAASFAGYLLGEFTNSFVLAKMKIATKGRWLWTRTIGSTLVGQLLDSGVFILIAFSGIMGWGALGTMVVTHWLVKTGYEALATPFTYMIVGYLKRKEGVDTYDYKTNFNPLLVFPFSLLSRRKASQE